MPRDWPLPPEDEVWFYLANEKPYGAFSNLYRRSVTLDGIMFPTAEHAYQYAKPRDAKTRDWLMACPSPGLLAKTAHQLVRPWEVAPTWSAMKVDRMRRVLEAKFTQHADLRKLLIETAPKRIVERGSIDDAAGRFWGVPLATTRPERCRNMLGTLLVELRTTLQHAHEVKPLA